jgi:PAS domain S-box-containing protein
MVLSNTLIQDILDSTPDATLVTDAAGIVIFGNKLIHTVFGYDSSELLGRPIDILLPERYRLGHEKHRLSFLRKASSRQMGEGRELYGLRKGGDEFPVEISLSPVESPSGMLVVSAIRDVSDRKLIESQLIDARDTAHKANQTKSRFLATASHDLRQPVQTLRLLNATLERLVSDDSIAQLVAQQKDALGSMSELLNALLDISKLESGAIKPDITDFAVTQIFERMRSQFAEQAEAKGLELQVEKCSDMVHCDQTLLAQVIQNLVANAIRYTNSGKVLLRCLVQQSCVRIEVYDTGIGIAENQLHTIFEEFTQLVSPDQPRKNDGFGLGLAIVERVADLLNLRIDVESSIGKGSRFIVEVPLAAETILSVKRTEIIAITENAAPAVSSFRILLVEDDKAVREATVTFLKVEGFQVRAVETIKQAIASIAVERPDIIVSDYHLLGTETGAQAIEQVRSVLGTRLPAILLSGDTSSVIDEENLVHCEFLNKPVDPEQLSLLINQLLM